jgi:heavy metal sensor kinase
LNARPRAPRRVTRGLRFRLTAAYALFLAALTITASVILRQYLANSLDTQAGEILKGNFTDLKAYLRIEYDNQRGFHENWQIDAEDPDEAAIKTSLERVFLLADAEGKIIDVSPTYQELGTDSPAQIKAFIKSGDQPSIEKKDAKGVPYLFRRGVILAEDRNHTRFYASLGYSLENNRDLLRQFTLRVVFAVPLIILTNCLMAWFLAGRGLAPVLEVAQAAQRISGSNLSLRIPTRGARDELDTLIETFNEMIARLEGSFGQIRQFSTDVSHELRTPLTILRGQLEVALFTAETKEQYREAIVDSLQDIERLGQIVRALLLLSQAETGQVLLQRTTLDLAELVRDIADQFEIPAEGAQVKLTIFAPGPCDANLDRVQIERMLSNLLSNAIKFTPAGGEVMVSLESHDGQAILTVADTGRGIPPNHLPHIFDRFYRVTTHDEAASPEKGLGLGLSFVAWIAKAHQGAIHVESEQGKGTSFVVTIPLALESNAVSAPTAYPAEEAASMKKI